MKKIVLFLSIVVVSVVALGQSPHGFNYQGIARDDMGNPFANTSISIRISIVHGVGSQNEEVLYAEVHPMVQTNAYGLFNLTIGEGTTANNFEEISWDRGDMWIETEVDFDGGNNFESLGSTKMMSVPYALYALESGTETDSYWGQTINGSIFYEDQVLIGRNTESPAVLRPAIQLGDGLSVFIPNNDGTPNYISANKVDQIFSIEASEGISFSTQRTNIDGWRRRMLINNDGNVGIGTESPQSPLEVNGTIHSTSDGFRFPDGTIQTTAATGGGSSLWSSSAPNNVYFEDQVFIGTSSIRLPITNPGLYFGDSMYIYLPNPDGSSNYLSGNKTDNSFSIQGSKNISFWTQRNGIDGWQKRVVIDNDGNMGIGTETPQSPLEVNGMIHSTASGFRFPDGTIQTTAALGGSSNWNLDGDNLFYERGLVGVGFDSPEYLLHIKKDVSSDPDLRTFIKLENTSVNNASSAGINMSSGNSGGYLTLSHNATSLIDPYRRDAGLLTAVGEKMIFNVNDRAGGGEFRFVSGGITEAFEKMRIDGDGNIGVGTVSPATKLHVSQGDIYLDDAANGVIMTSPNGSCFRLTVNDTGQPVFTLITCP